VLINPKVPASEIFPRKGSSLIENSANQVQHVRGCENPDRNRLAVDSFRPLPKAQTALAGCPGAKERLGGRAVLALCRGRCAMSRALGLKSVATCLSAGSHPPAAQSVTGRGCEKPNPKETIMTLARPMFPPVDPTRRRFLSQAAGVAAGGSVLALATIPPARAVAAPASTLDPVFSLIEAHRTARAAYLIALDGQNRLDAIGDRSRDWVAEAQYETDADAFAALIETAPTTFAGLLAWASYLEDISKLEAWMFEGEGPTLLVTLVNALGNLQVTS